ncbi:maleylpyruvate isomerase family mycothiol-dependent enzyme [Nonomuraea sp. NPDC050536]|uniref:maleylpyruvate isomerase family mycothiol-dependent enzyme n=1 Tax=Nonomuraea sp. NPDC050536 TaxID=3364366 RepID=UPI0037C8DF21
MTDDVFDDLAAEYRQLDAVLEKLTGEQWGAPSAAEGWSVADVVLHLAQSEEVIAAPTGAAAGAPAGAPTGAPFLPADSPTGMDELAEQMVAAERGMPPADLLARWREVAMATPETLREHPPGTRLPWVRTSLSPRTLATTRLAEHWAHALDITVPLGIAYPDTDRLRHIAWLAHRTLPYAFTLAGLPGVPVFCDLTAPGGGRWTYGDPASETRISGPAADFCRVGARRLAPRDSSLTAEGPGAADALRVVRNYAA